LTNEAAAVKVQKLYAASILVITLVSLVHLARAQTAPAVLTCRIENNDSAQLIIEINTSIPLREYDLEIDFDTGRYEFVDADPAESGINFQLGSFLSPESVLDNEIEDGAIYLDVRQQTLPLPTGSGELARGRLAQNTAVVSDFTVVYLALTDVDENEIPFEIQGCVNDVVVTATPTGTTTGESPVATPTLTPTSTATQPGSPIASPTATNTPTIAPPTATATPTVPPSPTPTHTPTFTPTPTSTPTVVIITTPTPAGSPNQSPLATPAGESPLPTPIVTPTEPALDTPTPTATLTPTPTATATSETAIDLLVATPTPGEPMTATPEATPTRVVVARPDASVPLTIQSVEQPPPPQDLPQWRPYLIVGLLALFGAAMLLVAAIRLERNDR
jgi:hypothetical protein